MKISEAEAFEAYQELRKIMVEKENESYIRGQVDVLFDIAMNMAKNKYYHNEKWDSQKTIDNHVDFCLTKLSHIFDDIEYELWCMMALIVAVK